jgi:hypothetical protein
VEQEWALAILLTATFRTDVITALSDFPGLVPALTHMITEGCIPARNSVSKSSVDDPSPFSRVVRLRDSEPVITPEFVEVRNENKANFAPSLWFELTKL